MAMFNNPMHRTELPKLIDDGTDNNYGEWKTKSYHKFREWDLLKYIEGPTSEPPIIPPLRETVTYHGVDDAGQLSTTHILGNANEHQQALTAAEPWIFGNNIALSRIVTALPSHQLHLVHSAKYAKQAWDSLRSVYQPRNSLRAATIKGQIMTYRCTADMNITKWLTDMQRLYNSLCDLDTERMSDRDFALAILDLMPQEDSWRSFVSDLRTKVREQDAQGLPIDSITFTSAIRDEDWHHHWDDHSNASQVFSTRYDALKRSSIQKRSRPADIIATTTVTTPAKRARVANPDKAHLCCTNPHCGPKTGHETADCIAYKGAKEGQYGDWWRGPWNIHLPPSQRSKENNIPPKSHPAYSRYAPTINQSQTADPSLDRSTTAPIQSDDNTTQANAALTPNTTFHVWVTTTDDNIAHTTLPVLNPALPRDNSCHHDSGANRHVFHDRSAFEHYESIPPLTVKGFGQNLSAVAIGCGTVRLAGQYDGRRCSIRLNNVLHIPAARTNLISGIQLDRAGVISTLGNRSIFLSSNNQTIISGSIVNDMYCLHLNIVPPNHNSVSLASRITPTDLASRIGPRPKTSGFYTAS